MKLSKSPLYFAQKSGKPIFCIACSVKGSKIIRKSWDQMMIPVPFSQGICDVVGPFYVSPEADIEEIEKIRQEIEHKMITQIWAADRKMGIEKIIPGTVAKVKKYSNTQGRKH